MKTLWQKSDKEVLLELKELNDSSRYDYRLLEADLCASIAHAKMLKKCSIIKAEVADSIIKGLNAILDDFKKDKIKKEDVMEYEDVHTFIEARLISLIGENGKAVHTARSRNDQVATAFRIYVHESIGDVIKEVKAFVSILDKRSKEHKDTIMPGFTHLQHAQPVSLGFILNAYSNMFSADLRALENALKEAVVDLPLGSAAFAGTTFDTDRFFLAKELGFQRPSHNAAFGVSDRDFVLHALHAYSLVALHLSRFAEEVVLWNSSEFGFITLDDRYSTGSSIMPQKKNPDIAELVRGKSARVFANYQRMLVVMKGLPLAYNKDMQEDKEAYFDSFDTIMLSLRAFAPMIDTATFNKENMLLQTKKGFMNATDAADYLVTKGMPFRKAYRIVGLLVEECIKKGISLEELPIERFKEASPLFGDDVREFLEVGRCVFRRVSYGGTGRPFGSNEQ